MTLNINQDVLIKMFDIGGSSFYLFVPENTKILDVYCVSIVNLFFYVEKKFLITLVNMRKSQLNDNKF